MVLIVVRVDCVRIEGIGTVPVIDHSIGVHLKILDSNPGIFREPFVPVGIIEVTEKVNAIRGRVSDNAAGRCRRIKSIRTLLIPFIDACQFVVRKRKQFFIAVVENDIALSGRIEHIQAIGSLVITHSLA